MENLVKDMDQPFYKAYKGKKVLITGHTGFKGSWLAIWLANCGAQVVGYALDPKTERDNFVMTRLSRHIKDVRGDVRDKEKLLKVFRQEKPEVVFHLAAQPLVFVSYQDPLETLETNIMGTAHVLEAIRLTDSVQAGVMITSDKCYDNREVIWAYRENDPLGGHDPYSASKGSAEVVIDSYRKSFLRQTGKAIASARAGNVVGGGDWSPYRLIPDVVRALEDGQVVNLRNPRALRPWQHVLQPLAGYLALGQALMEKPEEYSEAWNFGPFPQDIEPVCTVVDKMIRHFGKGQWKDVSGRQQLHEDILLTLDVTKAATRLHWKPLLTLDETIQWTSHWYTRYRNGNDMYGLCTKQIDQYWRKMNHGVIG